MSEWKKVEQQVGQPDSADLPAKKPEGSATPDYKKGADGKDNGNPTAAAPPPVREAVTAPVSSRRTTSGGRRRGSHRFASLLGLVVLILAAVGLISLVALAIQAIEKSQDDTALRTELKDFLSPVLQYDPSPFTDINNTQQDAPLLAAVWRVTEAERIRELRENTSVSLYELDDLGRMLIPISEIEASYEALFGPDAVIQHHSIGEPGLSFTVEYDAVANCYHVPISSSSTMYVPVFDTLKKKGNSMVIRVGFVLESKIGRDEKGNQVDPTPDMAEYFKLYTVNRTESDGWMLVSVTDEKGAATTAAGESESDVTESDETQSLSETTNLQPTQTATS